MELTELERAWRALDARVAAQALALEGHRHRGALAALRERVARLGTGLVAEIVVGVLIALWAGGYWTDRLPHGGLLASGLALHGFGIALIATAAAQLAALLRLREDAPVVELQRRVTELRRRRIAAERWMLILGALAWAPLMFIVFAALGVDLFATQPAHVAGNLAVATLLAVGVAWLSHRHRAAFERDACGRNLHEMEAELAALERGAD